MNIRGATILVTGAAGFIGGAVAERLLQEGARVRALVRSKRSGPGPNLELVQGDIRDPAAVSQAVQGCQAVVHCAARHISPGPAAEYRAVNVGATANLVSTFGRQTQPGGRFIHLSTINVMGLPPPRGAGADSPPRHSGDIYSDSKADGEKAARDAAQTAGVALTVIRPGCVYGPRGQAWTTIPIERLREGRPVLIGRGTGVCNSIYVDSLIELIIRALEREEALGQVLIGSDGVGVTWREFYEYYSRMLGGVKPRSVPYPVAVAGAWAYSWLARITGQPARLAPAKVAFYSHKVVFDISRTNSLLGYVPFTGLEEGMRRTESWLKDAGILPSTRA